MRALLPLAALAAALAAVPAPPPATACAIAPKDGGVRIADESALVVYDARAKVQHFVRTANFDTSGSDFGFFVPVPARPELAEASAAVFPALAKLTAARVVQKTERIEVYPSFLPTMTMAASAGNTFKNVGSAVSPAGPVTVLETKRVGDFDAAVLQATDAKTLHGWLTENGYSTRPALEKWFAHYVRENWFLVAFKVAADSPARGAGQRAVRISFPAEVPTYPYREPADTAEFGRKKGRLLKLFVVAPTHVGARIGDWEWEAGKKMWAKPVDEATLAPILAAGQVPELTGGQVLTEFADPSSPRVGFDDLTFPATPNVTATVERPDVIEWNYEYSYWKGYVVTAGVGLFVVACLAILARGVWRRVRRRGGQPEEIRLKFK